MPVAVTIHEFDDCKYCLECSSEAPECVLLSLSHPYELSAAAQEYASRAYAGIAEVHTPAEKSYQISLKVRDGGPGRSITHIMQARLLHVTAHDAPKGAGYTPGTGYLSIHHIHDTAANAAG